MPHFIPPITPGNTSYTATSNGIQFDPRSVLKLLLYINQAETGGIDGLTPVFAIRNGFQYLDFNDNQFKASGWVQRTASMVGRGAGVYDGEVPALPSLTHGTFLMAEYHADNGLGLVVNGVDAIYVDRSFENSEITRKFATNRMEMGAGNPGILTLYDDDGITVLKQFELRDFNGGPVVGVPFIPARRTNV